VSLSLKLRKQELSFSKLCQRLHLACINGHANIVEKLLDDLQEPDIDPLPEGSSVFLQVVRLGHALVVQQLLETT
jgi:ankyrin repeat protein